VLLVTKGNRARAGLEKARGFTETSSGGEGKGLALAERISIYVIFWEKKRLGRSGWGSRERQIN